MAARPQTVLFLGGSRYYIQGIEAAKTAGYRILVADRDADVPARSVANLFLHIDIVDVAGIVEAARRERVDAIIPLNDYGVVTAASACAALGLPGISPRTAHLASDKAAMRAQWVADGLPCPPFRVATDPVDVRSAVAAVGLPCILKPAHGLGGGSRGVTVITDAGQVDAAIAFAQSFYDDKALLIEGFVDAEVEHSAEVLVHDGVPHVLAISDKIKSPLPYRVDMNVLYPTRITGQRRSALEDVIKRAVLSLGITMGAAHVELATTSEGFVLFELGARSGGGGTPNPIIPQVTGVDAVMEMVRLYLGEPPRQLTPIVDRGCNYHFLFPPCGRLVSVEGLDAVLAMPGILDAAVTAKPGADIKPVRTGPDRSGFIIAAGASAEEALERGRAAEARLRFIYEAETA